MTETVPDAHAGPYARTPAAATWDLPPLPHPAPSFGRPGEEALAASGEGGR